MSPVPHIPAKYRPHGITFLYEDRDVIVVNKQAGVLTTATIHGELETAEEKVSNYLRKGCARSSRRAYLVHRLDRETSGVLLFAKSEEAQERIKANWPKNEKFYLALVEGHLQEKQGRFESYLEENDDYFVRSVSSGGKFSQTEYRCLRELPHATLVKVHLLTGRKNQIRVHFAEAGHPVVGDLKYGERHGHGRKPERMFLHAKSISFDQPFTGERLAFDAPIPPPFLRAVKGFTEEEWGRL